jgi:hypothetical protein
VKTTADGGTATASGALRDVNGAASGTTFTWAYTFGKDSYAKTATLSAVRNIHIVEPFVDLTGNQYAIKGTDSFTITTAGSGVWTVKVMSSSGAYALTSGENRAKYWCPFPGTDAYPLTITPDANAATPFTITYAVTHTN